MTAVAPRVGQLVRLLGSDRDGEIIAAAYALGRTLRSAGYDWHHLERIAEVHLHDGGDRRRPGHDIDHDDADSGFPVNPPINWRNMLRGCLEEAEWLDLNDRELKFLKSLKSWKRKPTTKQWEWLCSIAKRLGVEIDR